jgi:hypothetical protein
MTQLASRAAAMCEQHAQNKQRQLDRTTKNGTRRAEQALAAHNANCRRTVHAEYVRGRLLERGLDGAQRGAGLLEQLRRQQQRCRDCTATAVIEELLRGSCDCCYLPAVTCQTSLPSFGCRLRHDHNTILKDRCRMKQQQQDSRTLAGLVGREFGHRRLELRNARRRQRVRDAAARTRKCNRSGQLVIALLIQLTRTWRWLG